MTRRLFIFLFPALSAKSSFAFHGHSHQPAELKKFYITGYANNVNAQTNDCTDPPIEIYGLDREDAWMRFVYRSGVTVWTEGEYKKMRREIGADFDRRCEEAERAKEAIK